MNVLIVYAHPEPRSFNAAMKATALAALTEAGHQVEVSDLYAMAFDPVVRPDQFPVRLDPDYFSLQKEQRHAAETGAIAADVAAEHAKLLRAELIIFQFPLWWGSMPAILKGWIDRVFSVGTIYGRGTDGLKGRRALLSVTASQWDDYAEGAAYVGAELSHVTGNMLALSGLQALEPFYVFGASRMTEAERSARLQEYADRLKSIV